MQRLKIRHLTEYTFSQEVEPGPHRLMLRPRAGHDIRIESSTLDISPAHTMKWQRDLYGNSEAWITFFGRAHTLRFDSEIIVQHYESAPLDFLVDPQAALFPFAIDPNERIALIPYLTLCFPNDCLKIKDWLGQFWQPGQIVETYALLDRINKTIAQTLTYRKREEPGVQRPSETLAYGNGSCRDFATLFMEAARYFGLPARFVSGYLHCPGNIHGATHAWCEVYLPGAGWKSFDSTSGQVVGDTHIAVAVSRHPEDIPPVSGSFIGPGGTQSHMRVEVEVTAV